MTPGWPLLPFFLFCCIILATHCFCLRPFYAVPSAWNGPTPTPDICMPCPSPLSGLYSDVSLRGPLNPPHIKVHPCHSTLHSSSVPCVFSTALITIWHIMRYLLSFSPLKHNFLRARHFFFFTMYPQCLEQCLINKGNQ